MVVRRNPEHQFRHRHQQQVDCGIQAEQDPAGGMLPVRGYNMAEQQQEQRPDNISVHGKAGAHLDVRMLAREPVLHHVLHHQAHRQDEDHLHEHFMLAGKVGIGKNGNREADQQEDLRRHQHLAQQVAVHTHFRPPFRGCFLFIDYSMFPLRMKRQNPRKNRDRTPFFPASGPCLLLFQSANMGVDR